jgi:hypothetical protein
VGCEMMHLGAKAAEGTRWTVEQSKNRHYQT